MTAAANSRYWIACVPATKAHCQRRAQLTFFAASFWRHAGSAPWRCENRSESGKSKIESRSRAMVINMAAGASEAELQHVIDRVKECGFQPHVTRGSERAIVAAVGSGGSRAALEALKAAPGVEDVVPIAHPFKLVSRQTRTERTRVVVGGITIGSEDAVVIAGPCSVESEDQILSTARGVKAAGASLLRGGAYKPRTSPYDFQGLGLEALELLREARRQTGLPVVTEVMSTNDIQLISEYADMLQVGARNMQNYDLLRQLAKSSKPVLLKRGPSATIKEWLLAAE